MSIRYVIINMHVPIFLLFCNFFININVNLYQWQNEKKRGLGVGRQSNETVLKKCVIQEADPGEGSKSRNLP